MPQAALIGAAYFNSAHFATQQFDYVLAVDGGYAACRELGIVPAAVLGDFDSLGEVPDEANVQVHPTVKDESDMELALADALDQGCDRVLLYGALSHRLDHTLANIQLLSAAANRGVRCAGIGDEFALVALAGGQESTLAFDALDPAALTGAYGPYVSVFAVGGDAHGVTLEGLKYTLDHATVPHGVSLGLSNELVGTAARISVEDGTLIVSLPLQAWSHVRF